VRLPVAVCYDGFIISHSIERMEILEDEEVKGFCGAIPECLSSLAGCGSSGNLRAVDLQDYYTEHKRQQVEAMRTPSGDPPGGRGVLRS